MQILSAAHRGACWWRRPEPHAGSLHRFAVFCFAQRCGHANRCCVQGRALPQAPMRLIL
jgi:hypothetical protein